MSNLSSHEFSNQNVSRETHSTLLLDRLTHLAHLITDWDKRRSLISRADAAKIWERHILDGLRLLTHIREGAKIIDIGSGNGIPGLVIAAAGHPIDLVERSEGKAAFLRFATAEMGVAATIHPCDVRSVRGTYDILTARAVANTTLLLSLTEHLRSPQTLCLLMKGRTWAEELDIASKSFYFKTRIYPHTAASGQLGKEGTLSEEAMEWRHPAGRPDDLLKKEPSSASEASPLKGSVSTKNSSHKPEPTKLFRKHKVRPPLVSGDEEGALGVILELSGIAARPPEKQSRLPLKTCNRTSHFTHERSQ